VHDLDRDGRDDIIFGQNYLALPKFVSRMDGVMLLGDDTQFQRAPYMSNPYFSQTPTIMNSNGDELLVWVNMSSPVLAYVNNLRNRQSELSVDIPQTADYIGAQVTLHTTNTTYNKQNLVGRGFGSDHSSRLVFGLMNEKPQRLVVQKTNGRQVVKHLNGTEKLIKLTSMSI
jgi:hypothetical protein